MIQALIEVLEDLQSELTTAELGGRATAVEEELRLTIEMARGSGLPDRDLERVIGRELNKESPDGEAS